MLTGGCTEFGEAGRVSDRKKEERVTEVMLREVIRINRIVLSFLGHKVP